MDGTMTVAIQNTYPHLSLKSKTTKYYTMLYSGSVEYIYMLQYMLLILRKIPKPNLISISITRHSLSLIF